MRLFVGIPVSDEVRRLAAAVRGAVCRDGPVPGMRWEPPDKLHITLRFLGEVPDADVAGVCRAVAEVASAAEPFALTAGGVGTFPPRGLPRVFWLGAGDADGKLTRLAADMDAAVRRLGFPAERLPFHAHITLARLEMPPRGLELPAAAAGSAALTAPLPVSSVTVFESRLGRGGSVYAPAAECGLGTKNLHPGDRP